MRSRRTVLSAAAALAAGGLAPAEARARAAAVTTVAELIDALNHPVALPVCVVGRLDDVPELRLRPGQVLLGRGGAEIRFRPGVDGLRLSSDNTVGDLGLRVSPERRAVFNDTAVADLGQMRLFRLAITGQVQILARDQVRGGHVRADHVHVEAADVRDRQDRPSGFGVEPLQGAFTLWNQQADAAVRIVADLTALSAGRPGAPVLGSGIFVAGAQPGGGTVHATRIETGTVHSDGRIPPGTQDRITAGVFVVHGVDVDSVRNAAAVATYGVNDMVLNNWGDVDRWVAQGAVTSFGASGTGFVNFGRLGRLQIGAVIETHGPGARGFNVYAGTVGLAEFRRIVTRGDGAVGMQIGQPVGRVHVLDGIETYGATGPSLVKGVLVTLAAIPLSVTPSGSAHEIVVGGGLVTHGAGIPTLEILGSVGTLAVRGGVRGAQDSDPGSRPAEAGSRPAASGRR